jgi:hypothetical protein
LFFVETSVDILSSTKAIAGLLITAVKAAVAAAVETVEAEAVKLAISLFASPND